MNYPAMTYCNTPASYWVVAGGIRWLPASIVLVVLLCWSPPAPGSAWVSTHTYNGTGYSGEFAWRSEESDEIICTSPWGCSVAVCHFSAARGSFPCVNPSHASTWVLVKNGASAKDAHLAFTAKNGSSGTWSTTSRKLGVSTCFGIMYWQGSGGENRSGRVLPGSYCGSVPPPTTSCELENDVVIDYGALASGAVQGSRKSASLNVRCTATTDIIITLVEGKSIRVGGGITSKLSIYDTDLSSGAKITAPAGSRSFPITSTLTAVGQPLVGSYNGSGVIVLGYQ